MSIPSLDAAPSLDAVPAVAAMAAGRGKTPTTLLSPQTSSIEIGHYLLHRQESHMELPVLTKDESAAKRAEAKRAWCALRLAAMLAVALNRARKKQAEAREAEEQGAAELGRPASSTLSRGPLGHQARLARRPMSAFALDRRLSRTDRMSSTQKETRRVERSVHAEVEEAGRAARHRAMVRLAHPLNRPYIKDILGLSDEQYEQALDGNDFDWEQGDLAAAGEFCCLCADPWLDHGLGEAASCVCACEGETNTSAGTSRLEVEHTDTLPAPPMPDLRYGSGYEVPRPHRYHRLLNKKDRAKQPEPDPLLELFEELLQWMQELVPGAAEGAAERLEAKRLCQTLTLERDEAMAPAIDLQEMWTVPHETALRAYALHKSRREAVYRMLRRDARAADRPPARAVHRNVAFLRCVPMGDAAYCKVPDVLRLAVEQPPDLVSFEKVWCCHMLPLRITKKFCQFLAGHPFVPRPEALVRAGLLQQLAAGMVPPAPPLLASARRPPVAVTAMAHDHGVIA